MTAWTQPNLLEFLEPDPRPVICARFVKCMSTLFAGAKTYEGHSVSLATLGPSITNPPTWTVLKFRCACGFLTYSSITYQNHLRSTL